MENKGNKKAIKELLFTCCLYIIVIGWSYGNSLEIKENIWTYLREKMDQAHYPASLYLVNLVFRHSWVEILLTPVIASFTFISLWFIKKICSIFRSKKTLMRDKEIK